MPEPVVEVSALTKSYGSLKVLDDVEFQIPPGRLIGFLGPNGAGKTTTIRILLGLLTPSSGSVRLFGRPVEREGHQLRARVGYLAGEVGLYSNMTARQMLRFLSSARSIDCDAEIERLTQRFELPLDRRVRKFSTGMKQKLGLIQAMMHRPELMILDEPTSALDPLVRQKVFAELRDVVREGRTVLFSSHSLDEVEELCDDVVILREGKVVEHQSIEILRTRALRRVQIEFSSVEATPNEMPSDVQVIKRDSLLWTVAWTGQANALIAWLQTLKLSDVIIERPDLNDLFITYYSKPESGSPNRPADKARGKGVSVVSSQASGENQ